MDPRDETLYSYQSRKFVEHSSSTSSLNEDSEPNTGNAMQVKDVGEEHDNVLSPSLVCLCPGEIPNDFHPGREVSHSARPGHPAYCQIRDQKQPASDNDISPEMREQFYTQRPGSTLGKLSQMMPRMMSGGARRTIPGMTPRAVSDMEVMDVDTRMGYRLCSIASEEDMQYHQNAPQMGSSLDSSEAETQSEPPESQEQSRNDSGQEYLCEAGNSDAVTDESSDQGFRCSCNGMRKAFPPPPEASYYSMPEYVQRGMDCRCSGFNMAGSPNLWGPQPSPYGSSWSSSVDGYLSSTRSLPQPSLPNCMPPCPHMGLPPVLCLSAGLGHAPFPGMIFNAGVQSANHSMDPIQNQSVYAMDYRPINLPGNVFNHFPNRHPSPSCMSGQAAPGPAYMIPPAFMPPCIYGYPAPFPMACSPQPGAPCVPGYVGYGPAPPELLFTHVISQPVLQ